MKSYIISFKLGTKRYKVGYIYLKNILIFSVQVGGWVDKEVNLPLHNVFHNLRILIHGYILK